MKVTKQSTYSWDAATNVSEQEAIDFANQILSSVTSNSSSTNIKFEIAPKSTEIQADWDTAIAYCDSLTIDGKTGWRLPTKEELNEIYESNNDFQKDWYWSSNEDNCDDAWNQYFRNGYQYNANKGNCGYVRAIRSFSEWNYTSHLVSHLN